LALPLTLELALVMLATGLLAGFLAGLLGVGGGIVIVPVLEAALGFLGVDPAVRMHVAVATSLATIVPTSIASARAHHARGALDLDLARRWCLPLLLGAAGGSILATQVHTRVLAAVFGCAALLVAVKMILPLDGRFVRDGVPRGVMAAPLPAVIGAVSAMMGIGGGTLSVPVLTLLRQPIHRAVATAALFGLVISVPGTIAYLLAQPDAPLPPGNVGLVNLIGVAVIAPVTMLTAPWGARVAHALSARALSGAFGMFLLVVALRMLYRAWNA
jgi:uncharacterized membrane protein YfcA